MPDITIPANALMAAYRSQREQAMEQSAILIARNGELERENAELRAQLEKAKQNSE